MRLTSYIPLYFAVGLSVAVRSSSTVVETTTTSLVQATTDTSADGNVDKATKNCSSNADRPDIPCEADECYLRHIPVDSGNQEEEPCFTGNHQVVYAEQFSAYTIEQDATVNLPTNQWILFKTKDDKCQSIVNYNDTSSTCIVPGYCGSSFPWYLKANVEQIREFGKEIQTKLCMTDRTQRQTAVCCQNPVEITVKSCGFYRVYKLTQAIPEVLRGGICTAPTKSFLNGVEAKAVNLINSGYSLPKRFDELTTPAKDNLVTTKFGIVLLDRLHIHRLITKYNVGLIEQLNKFYRKRAKRQGQKKVTQLTVSNVKTIVGSPALVDGKLYYTYYIESDNGDILPQELIARASKYLSNPELTHYHGFILSTDFGINEKVNYPQDAQYAASQQRAIKPSKENNNWMIIIYIINFTCAVVIAALIALAIYRWRLQRRLKTNQHKPLSKLDKVLLCEKHSIKSDQSMIRIGDSNSVIRIGHDVENPPCTKALMNSVD